MSDDFEIRGEGDFYRLSKALKASGHKEMRKTLNQRMRRAGKPMIAVVRQAALEELPKGGGLNEVIAKRPIRVTTRTGQDPGIKLVMPKTQPGYLFGDIKHPVFERDKEHRGLKSAFGEVAQAPWVEQHIGPGEWFDDTIVKNSDIVRTGIEQGVQSVIDDIIRKGA